MALRECRAVLACWTPLSLASEWCGWECAVAQVHGKLVPVSRAPTLTVEDLGARFYQLHYLKCHDWDGQADHEGWGAVLAELAARLEAWVRAFPDHPERAATDAKVRKLRGDSVVVVSRGLDAYDAAIGVDLQSTPWALQAPTPPPRSAPASSSWR